MEVACEYVLIDLDEFRSLNMKSLLVVHYFFFLDQLGSTFSTVEIRFVRDFGIFI